MIRNSVSGGIVALRGFDYQATVILDRLFAYFDEHGPDAMVRPEGIDDLDLEWAAADGSLRQRFEQIKKPCEDINLNTTSEPWTLADIARELIPGALRNLDGNAHEQVWILGDEVEAEVASLIAAGLSAPSHVPTAYWRVVHLLARDEALKAFPKSTVKSQLMRWSLPADLSPTPDIALTQLSEAFRQRVIELGANADVANKHVAAAQRFHAHLPDVLGRTRIESLFGSEQEIALRVRGRLERDYGLKPSVVKATLFRNLRGFINDIAKQPDRHFNKEEFELELRTVWPTMMPIRELPHFDEMHIPRADLSTRFTTNWTGRALEVIGVSGSGKTMLAAEVGKQSHVVAPERHVIYAEARQDTGFRDVMVGAAFHLRRIGLGHPFSIAVDVDAANDTALERLARAMSVLPQDVLLLIDLVEGICSDAFARDLATFLRFLNPRACRIGVLGQESAFRSLNHLDRNQLEIESMDVRGFNFDEFVALVSKRHPHPDYALLHDVFGKVTACRSAGLYARLAQSLADAPSLEAMRDLAKRPAEEILEYAERQRYARVSVSARSAAEKLVCFALPFGRPEAEEVFTDANVGAAICELLDLGLLRPTGDDSYEMHETIRAGLEGIISHSTRQKSHKELADHYEKRRDVTAKVFHLDRAGLREEAYKCAREAFLRGERWPGLARFVTAHKLVTPHEVVGVVATPVKIEDAHLLAEILSQLGEPIDAKEILTVLRAQPQRFLADYRWASALVDACLSLDPSRLCELIQFCLGIVCEPDQRKAGLSAILIAARRNDYAITQEILFLFDATTLDVKRSLIPFLLAGGRRESFAPALSLIANDECGEPDHRQGRWPEYSLTLRNRSEVVEFLAALPTVPDHEMLMSHSPLLGPLTSLVWRNRHLLKTHGIDLLQTEGVEPSVQKAAIRVLALLAEPRLCTLCEALAQEKENPIHGFAALAPTLVPTLVDRNRYEATLFNPEQDIETRMAALSVLASVGVDLDTLYERVQIAECDSGRSELYNFIFLQNAIITPFAAAIPLLEAQLWSIKSDKAYIFGAALEQLGRLPDTTATSMLLKALSHPDHSVQMAATLALGRKRTKTALSKLKECFHSEKDSEFRVQLATAMIASGAQFVADLGTEAHVSEALSLWRCVLAARTRDATYAPQLVELAIGVKANWQLRRAAINAAGFLPFEAALSKMLPILRERSPLRIDDHQSLYTHGILSWLLLTESGSLLPRFINSRTRFVELIEGILDDAKGGLIDSRGLPPETEAAGWLYDRLSMHGWPETPSAPDVVINELHIPLLQSAIVRALRRAGRCDLIKTELAKADHVWIATKCLVELRRDELPSTELVDQIKELVAHSSVASDPRLQAVVADLAKVVPLDKSDMRMISQDAPEEPTWQLLNYEEARLALGGNDPVRDLKSQAPIVLDALTFEQFDDLVRLSDPVNDRHENISEHYIPGISFMRDGHSVARRQQTYSGGTEPAGAWIRPALVAANHFKFSIPWHVEILSGAYPNTYAERLISCLSARGDADAFYRTLYQDPHLLLPHICSYAARQQVARFIDDRMIPFLTMHVSSGTDEIFEGLCGIARALVSQAVDPVLSALFKRWTAHFQGCQRASHLTISIPWWRAFRSLTEHPRFNHVKDWYALLSPVLYAPLRWHKKQDVTRVLERDPRSYIQLESLLFKSEDWEHFYEDEIERLQEAAERLFKQVES